MALIPQTDEEFLRDREVDYEIKQVGQEVYLVLRNYTFPAAYAPQSADVLIRILPGYPLTKLDMFWTRPDVRLANGAWPQAADVHENYDGQSWQRWSRHTAEWRAGVDNLRTFITAIRQEIDRGI